MDDEALEQTPFYKPPEDSPEMRYLDEHGEQVGGYIPALREMAVGEVRRVRPFVEEFTMPDGRKLHLLADGRLVNLSAAEGHPASVMDMSFDNQALGAEYMIQNAKDMEPNVYVVPEAIDMEIARLKLASMGVSIDRLTPEQEKYLSSWEMGT